MTETKALTTDLVTVPTQAPAPLTRTSTGPTALAGMPGCPNLTDALSKARDSCGVAEKKAKNTFHNFNYADADTIISVASQAMQGSGLALISVSDELTVKGTGGMAFYALDRKFILSHSSGEYVPLEVKGWPVVPEKGRPLDKAFATALTSSLAYKLRDLLQMARGKEHDMSARPAGRREPTPEPTANGSAEPDHRAAALATTEAARAERYGPAAKGSSVVVEKVSTEQRDRIASMLPSPLDGEAWKKVAAWLQDTYGVDRIALLGPTQANDLERRLIEKAKKTQTQTATPTNGE